MKEQEHGNFDIQNSVTIEELEKNKNNMEWLQNNIITLEDLLKDTPKLQISKNQLEKLYNGVKILVNVPDGVYSVYCDNKFVGSGVAQNNEVKRDIIVHFLGLF